jgi:hypothetical protein
MAEMMADLIVAMRGDPRKDGPLGRLARALLQTGPVLMKHAVFSAKGTPEEWEMSEEVPDLAEAQAEYFDPKDTTKDHIFCRYDLRRIDPPEILGPKIGVPLAERTPVPEGV